MRLLVKTVAISNVNLNYSLEKCSNRCYTKILTKFENGAYVDSAYMKEK